MKSTKSKLFFDIGVHNIKIIEVEERRGCFFVVKHLLFKTPPDVIEDSVIKESDSFVHLITNQLKTSGIKAKNAIVTVTSPHILSREVILPKGNLKEMAMFAEVEAPNKFPIDISQYSVDFKIIEEVIEEDIAKYKVLLLITPLKILESYVSLFENCGLFLEKIDFKGNSICKLIKQSEEAMIYENPVTTAVIDIGYNNSSITICNNGVLKYSRSLAFGSNEYNKEIINILDCSEEEAEGIKTTYGIISEDNEDNLDMQDMQDIKKNAAKQAWITSSTPLFDEITRVFDFFASRNNMNSIDRILLAGGGSLIPGLLTFMQNSFDMQIDFLSCKEAIDFTEPNIDLNEFSAYFSNCVGAVFNE